MHLGHERDPGQMLAETIMQVLANSPLLPGTYIQDCLFQMLSFRDVDTSSDDVACGLSIAGKQGARPGNEPLLSMARNPTSLIVLRQKIRTQHFKIGPE